MAYISGGDPENGRVCLRVDKRSLREWSGLPSFEG
jgi:hypothetical protein